MAFQLAHYQLHGHSAATYESANQSAYKHGRTETVRSCTPESDIMCKTFFDKSASSAAKLAALRTAVKNHGTITREALMGAGWDRHMFALKYEAQKNGLDLPAIFSDVSYQRLSEIILSTSTLSSPVINGGGFGPTGDRCYGIGYTTGVLRGVLDSSIRDQDGFACSVMAYTNHRDPHAFTDSIKSSLKMMRDVLDEN
jgi:carnitine O-palmitoyltransferase 2